MTSPRLIGALIALLGSLLMHAAPASTLRPIYAFTGVPDGSGPEQQVSADAEGHLFLTTLSGGEHNEGAVIEMVPPSASGAGWSERVLHSFSVVSDGGLPESKFLVDANGNLTGTTSEGGALGGGTLWTMTYDPGQDSWSFAVAYNFGFCDARECAGEKYINPGSGVVQDSHGRLFGTGTSTAYILTPQAQGGYAIMILHVFNGGADGQYPTGELAIDKTGNLYGVTNAGGPANFGTVYRLDRPVNPQNKWDEEILWSFTGNSDGYRPRSGLTLGSNNTLFGTTEEGPGLTQYNGTVFQLTPPAGAATAWQLTTLGVPDGELTWGPVAFDHQGNAYVVTQMSSTFANNGTIYKLVPPATQGAAWSGQTAATFDQRTGVGPIAGMTLLKGRFYGPAAAGGKPKNNAGTVYAFHP